ncbi:MAG: electron transfer flavoprotein subunit alpha/FixB family protein [Spirochaetes bacterium]|nr:electron transfer flavoprotein subunit alpha/FixB family protein [Spirochaetota bacterium]
MSVLVIIDTIENRPSAGSFEILTFAEKLAAVAGLPVRVVIAGQEIASLAEDAARYGFDVTGIEHESFRYPNPDFTGRAVLGLMKEYSARYVCLPHTMRGCQTAAFLAASADTHYITAVESFAEKNDEMSFRRALFNGKVYLELSPGEASVFTVQGGSYKAPDSRDTPGTVEVRALSGTPRYRPTGVRESEEESVRLEESDVIISAGRGIGSRENLELIKTIAKVFPNGAVGASRTICDQKWLPYAHQVGITGKTVAPKLYMACGISGAQQHIAGMKGSQTIVAINKDPRAAIFSIADYIIVEDLATFLPILIEKYAESFK